MVRIEGCVETNSRKFVKSNLSEKVLVYLHVIKVNSKIFKTSKMRAIVLFIFILSITISTMGQKTEYNKLTPEEERVIIHKGTEIPYSGEYYYHDEEGIYTCKQCGAELYRSTDKFDAQCGWPSFDDEIEGAVTRTLDADGRRTEITCTNCGGHLGHVFLGEGFTEKNTRHCVNSISLDFKPLIEISPIEPVSKEETAYFASGCFWGTEYHFENKEGVISTEVGYMGGHIKNPSYREVCTGRTGHAETLKVVFDPSKVSYEDLAKIYFETHDPGQLNRQGPDIGTQYRSAVFYTTDAQKETIDKLIKILRDKNYKVVTELVEADKFYPAENYHQNYYTKKGGTPYCHIYQKKF
jgi:peptide methionine sulfoxide reductase msrA/msrB